MSELKHYYDMQKFSTTGLLEFPACETMIEGMKTLYKKERLITTYIPNIVYQECDGRQLKIQIVKPMTHPLMATEEKKQYPLIVLIPGSGWKKQNDYKFVPNLVKLAERGFVVASVEYRPSDYAIFPAQILDTKAAIRFLQEHAGEYEIDKENVIIFGDSSGGHTALMVGYTQGTSMLEEDGQSHDYGIKGVIDWYGPVDILKLREEPSLYADRSSAASNEGAFVGTDVNAHPELAEPTIVTNYITKEREIPPTLIFHGTRDGVVHFEQSVILYQKLREEGKQVEFYRMVDGIHGGGEFWDDEVMDIMSDFAHKALNK
jgi:acetyl esterase/lipase